MSRYLQSLFIFGCCVVLGVTKSSAAEPAGFTAQQVIQAWGWIIARQNDLAGIDINAAELSAFLKGFSANLKNQPAPYDLTKIYPDVEQLGKIRREKLVLAATQKNEAQAKTFFSKLKQDTNVIVLADGVCYQTLRPGTGPAPRPQQTVTVHYTGYLIDGTEFVQMENYDVVLVTNRLSSCLFEGLQQMKKGGTLKLYVPPPLPEGDDVRLGIPPGSTMVYDIELLDIKDTAPGDLEVALLPAAPEPPAPPPSGFTGMQAFETWGWIIAGETRAATFGLDETNRSLLAKGLAAGIQNLPPPYDPHQVYPAVEKFVTDNREKVRLATKQKRLAEMNALFAGLKNNTNLVELPDGLRYEILKNGHGPYPQTGQIVIVDYTGTLVSGKVFDRTDNEPLHIEIGAVMPGLNEGLQKINKGGEIKLYVPPALGYGDEDSSSVISSVPADSVLLYDIKLLDIQNEVAPAPR